MLKNKIKLSKFFCVVLMFILAFCFVLISSYSSKSFANSQNNAEETLWASNATLENLIEGDGNDYVFTKYKFDGEQIFDPSENSDFCMFNIINRDAMKSWHEDGSPRYWIMEQDCVLKNHDENFEKAHLLMKYDTEQVEGIDKGYLYIECRDNNGQLMPISYNCVLTDGSKARYNIDEENPQPVKIYRESIKYEISKIAYIQLKCANTTTRVDAIENETSELLNSYDEEFSKNQNLNFCLDAENKIDAYLSEIYADECWLGYLNRPAFKIDDLKFRNIENARGVIVPKKYERWANFLITNMKDSIDRAENVNGICVFQTNNIEIAKQNFQTWLKELQNYDSFSIVEQHSLEIEQLAPEIEEVNEFTALYNKIKQSVFLAFMFDRFANSNNSNVCFAEERISQAILQYRKYGNKSNELDTIFDVNEYLNEASFYDVSIFQCWHEIFTKWIALNQNENYVNINTLPQGLPNDGSMCIAVHGFKLHDDGTPDQEFIDRLDIAFKTWQTYPNSFIAIMGGGTAKEDSKITEALVGANYLLTKGVPRAQLIIEDKSLNTIENVDYLYKILCINSQYSSVKNICVCSSDYHIRRCATLWEGKCVGSLLRPDIYNNNIATDIKLVSNCASKTEKDIWTEKQDTQGLWLTRLLMYVDYSGNIKGILPSTLDSIELQSDTVCYINEKFNPKIVANFIRDNSAFFEYKNYNENLFTFNYDVSNLCNVECDTSKIGKSICNVTFSYNDPKEDEPVVKTLTFDVNVIGSQAENYFTTQTWDKNFIVILLAIISIAIFWILKNKFYKTKMKH